MIWITRLSTDKKFITTDTFIVRVNDGGRILPKKILPSVPEWSKSCCMKVPELYRILSKPEGSREVNVWASGRGKIGVMFCFNMWIRSHTLSFSFSLSLTQTHTHTHMHRLTQILAVRHHNYSTNCCPARCRPVRIMSQHTNDSFGLLIMQFLWSAPLAHAKPQSLCGSS